MLSLIWRNAEKRKEKKYSSKHSHQKMCTVLLIHYGTTKRECLLPQNGGCSSVVSASEFKLEDPGFDPQAEQGKGQFFCPSE